MSKLLLIIDFPLSKNLCSGGIRYLELAQALKTQHEVTLAGTTIEKDFDNQGLNILKISPFKNINLGFKLTVPNKEFIEALSNFDLVITGGGIIRSFGNLKKIKAPLLIDLYGPWFIENLAGGKTKCFKENLKAIFDSLKAGTFFLCANENQKDLYIGLSLAAGCNNPKINNNIGIVPIGISDIPPKRESGIIKGIFPGIKKSDKLIIWWSGIWSWLDPLTLIKAMAIIATKRKDIKAAFLGVQSFEKTNQHQQIINQSFKLAEELKIKDKFVFFINEWLPYAERDKWLIDGDLGIISHNDNIETRFAWRTRALDYLWANLPIVTTQGDAIAELVHKYNLGRVVPYCNPEALSQAILELLDNQEEYQKIKQNINAFIPNLYWKNLIGPINDFCQRLEKK